MIMKKNYLTKNLTLSLEERCDIKDSLVLLMVKLQVERLDRKERGVELSECHKRWYKQLMKAMKAFEKADDKNNFVDLKL